MAMKVLSIKDQIKALGEEKLKSLQEKYRVGNITPYAYQCVMFDEIGKRIGRYTHPFFVKASVSAGKTIGFAMVAHRISEMGLSMAILARQSEIVAQDSEEITNYGVPNSVYCAGLNTKSAYFPILVGSEGSVANGMFKALGDFAPMVLGIDECHQVDWEDLATSIKNNESREEMTRPSDEAYLVNGVKVEPGIKVNTIDQRMNTVQPGAGRSQYTQIIREFQRRCKEQHGKELRIFGMTGSEFRGTTPILVEDMNELGFWREQVTNIDTNYLVEFGSVVPTNFGSVGELGYDLSEFEASSTDGVQEFDAKTLKAMEKKIHESGTMTQQIMSRVAEICKDRNGVLVTCAGERHCKEAAAALPEGETFRIITGKTGEKKRKEYLQEAFEGKVKYIFQVQALTTGVNVPFWDTSVILRKISSLTLLIQLLGRGMRLLKQWHVDQGFTKSDHLVLDFAGCLDELGELYFDPMLEQAQYQRRKSTKKDPIKCELCGGENSAYARRCIHVDEKGNRCEYFWKSKTCDDQYDEKTKKLIHKGCGVENDVAARQCRGCGLSLIDPNERLSGKHYTKDDYLDVVSFNVGMTKNGRGIVFTYELAYRGDTFKAYERFFPESSSPIPLKIWRSIALKHIKDRQIAGVVASYRNAQKIMQYAHHIRPPVRVTHRKNGKGEDIIHKREFE